MKTASHRLLFCALSLTLAACGSETSGTASTAQAAESATSSAAASAAEKSKSVKAPAFEPAPEKAPETGKLPAPETKADEMIVTYIKSFGGIADAFASVTDNLSAAKASETIAKIKTDLGAKATEWEGLAKDQIQASTARYATQIKDAQAKLTQSTSSLLSNPQYASLLSKAMESMPEIPQGK
jgi:hypothetical protein